MKKLLITLMLALPLAAGGAFAQDKKAEPKKEEKKAEMKKEEKKEMSPQQKKMADCSSESKGLKGDEYKKKHAACMKGEKPAAAKDEKKTKLAECSSQAKGLKGDEYKKKRDDCMAK